MKRQVVNVSLMAANTYRICVVSVAMVMLEVCEVNITLLKSAFGGAYDLLRIDSSLTRSIESAEFLTQILPG